MRARPWAATSTVSSHRRKSCSRTGASCSLRPAGDKYGITDLKKACEESLRRDVSTENVLERLQTAHTYGLPALRRTCVRLLVDFGKMYEIPEDFVAFMAAADQDLADEIRSTAILRGRKLAAREK